MGRRPLPAVRDFTRDGRWSTYDVSVRKKMGGRCAETGYPLKLLSPTNLARLGPFPPACRPGVLCICLFSVAPLPVSLLAGPPHPPFSTDDTTTSDNAAKTSLHWSLVFSMVLSLFIQ